MKKWYLGDQCLWAGDARRERLALGTGGPGPDTLSESNTFRGAGHGTKPFTQSGEPTPVRTSFRCGTVRTSYRPYPFWHPLFLLLRTGVGNKSTRTTVSTFRRRRDPSGVKGDLLRVARRVVPDLGGKEGIDLGGDSVPVLCGSHKWQPDTSRGPERSRNGPQPLHLHKGNWKKDPLHVQTKCFDLLPVQSEDTFYDRKSTQARLPYNLTSGGRLPLRTSSSHPPGSVRKKIGSPQNTHLPDGSRNPLRPDCPSPQSLGSPHSEGHRDFKGNFTKKEKKFLFL